MRVLCLFWALAACSSPIANSPSTEGTAQPEPVYGAVAVVSSQFPEYDRSEWHKRWLDADGDCQDTRQEVLIAESQVPPVMDERGCRVVSGEWHDPYTDRVFTDPSDLDIDHFVALGNAHRSGGWMWDEATRKAFANDLEHPEALIAVYKGANRSKGDRGPDEWLPPNEDYRCTYVHDWLAVKAEWGLTLTPSEVQAILALDCPDC